VLLQLLDAVPHSIGSQANVPHVMKCTAHANTYISHVDATSPTTPHTLVYLSPSLVTVT